MPASDDHDHVKVDRYETVVKALANKVVIDMGADGLELVSGFIDLGAHLGARHTTISIPARSTLTRINS